VPHTPRVERLYVHIVTYGEVGSVARAIESLLCLDGFSVGRNLTITVTDNGPTNATADAVARQFADAVALRRNRSNLGFCGGQNQGVTDFLAGAADYLLVLNPDVRLEQSAPIRMVEALKEFASAGMSCPRLFRATESLDPVQPTRIDSAGMRLTGSLRHFDRGAESRSGFDDDAWVFGGSGACLMLKRRAVSDLLIPETPFDSRLFKLYPQLAQGERRQLFDESYFAYREDADLAWRAQLCGWRCRYVASAVGYHTRKVTPQRRSSLPPEINRLGVRNRFLLQINNSFLAWSVDCFKAILLGGIWRNLLVAIAVLVKEPSSRSAFGDLAILWPRARYIRNLLSHRRTTDWQDTWRWCSRD
jgi:GT2 family glycosyltransferase